MADDRIKLGLDLGNATYAVAELSSNLGDLKKSAQGVADTYEVLAGAGANYAAVERDVDAATAKAVERTQAQKAIRQALDESTEATNKARRSISDYGQEVRGAGYIVQDFAQGGLGGILNNIDQVLVKFPLAAGVVTAVATAVYVALPTIKEWWREWQDGANDLPKTLDGLDALNERLSTNKKRLDELKGQQKVTNTELEEFNRLAAENARLQDEQTARSVKGKAASEAGAGFRKALEEFGGGEALLDQLAGTDPSRRASLAEDIRNALQGDRTAMGYIRGRDRGFDEMMDRNDPAKAAAAKEAEDKRQAEIQQSIRDRLDWEKRQADQKEQARRDKEKADNDAKRAKEKADAERAAFEAKLDAPNVKAAIDAELEGMERALNGGFTGAESQQIASGNMALAEAGRGQSSEDKLQKIIQQNQAMMNSLSLSGGDGSAAMSAFMELQTQLLWTLGQLREVRMQQQQWRQMQQTSGTLLSRGRG